jgi:hypothetical protein
MPPLAQQIIFFCTCKVHHLTSIVLINTPIVLSGHVVRMGDRRSAHRLWWGDLSEKTAWNP